MKLSKSMIGLSAVVWFSGATLAGIADFYTLDSEGNIFVVNGSTLEASHIIDLAIGAGGLEHELLYLSDGGILVNNGRNLVRYDIASGDQRIVFDGSTSIGQGSLAMGLAATSDGEVFMTVQSLAGPNVEWYGATYDPFSGEFERLADYNSLPSGAYFDHHQVGDHLFLGADWGGQRISVIDSLSGESTFYDVDFAPVSFFESNDEVYAISKGGEIFTFDILTGVSDLFGTISGGNNVGGWIGAASTSAPFILPAPSSLALFGLMGIAATRRRR